MSNLGDLISSTHAAVYTYGVVSAFAHDSQLALDYQSTYRHMRDQLIELATKNELKVPSAQAAYELPLRVHNNATAKAVAAQLENSMCNQWASAICADDVLMTDTFLLEPENAALRAFSWSGIAQDFPA